MKTTKQIFKKANLEFLNEILKKDEGIIYSNSVTNPNDEIFNKSLKEIVKIQNNALNACVFEALKNSKN